MFEVRVCFVFVLSCREPAVCVKLKKIGDSDSPWRVLILCVSLFSVFVFISDSTLLNLATNYISLYFTVGLSALKRRDCFQVTIKYTKYSCLGKYV